MVNARLVERFDSKCSFDVLMSITCPGLILALLLQLPQEYSHYGAHHIVLNASAPILYFIFFFFISIATVILLPCYGLKNDKDVLKSYIPMILCSLRIFLIILAIICGAVAWRAFDYGEREILLDMIQNTTNNEIHKIQKAYHCCGVAVEKASDAYKKELEKRLRVANYSAPNSIWRAVYVLGPEYLEKDRNTSLPFSCCKNDKLDCAALGYENWKEIIEQVDRNETVSDTFLKWTGFNNMSEIADKYRDTIYTKDCAEEIQKDARWTNILGGIMILVTALWHIYLMIEICVLVMKANEAIGNGKCRALSTIFFPRQKRE